MQNRTEHRLCRDAAENPGWPGGARTQGKILIDISTAQAVRKASANGHTATVRVLLEAGADVRAKEDWALQWAVKNGQTDTIRVLNEWMAREAKKPAEGSETT